MVNYEGALLRLGGAVERLLQGLGALGGALRRALYALMGKKHIWTTQQGVEIYVERGNKSQSPHDFIVRYKEPGKRLRTPKHVHLIVELYVKEAYNKTLTHDLRDHLIWVFDQVQPITSYPPTLQVYEPNHAQRFAALDNVGEFSVEFLLIVSELIFIQEKTNYPQGSLTKELYEAFGVMDRFSVIHKATYGR
jgi:hypothetical protein